MNISKETSKKVTVLRMANGQALIKIERFNYPLNGYVGTRYEWWNDLEKMEQGIYTEPGGKLYCSGYAGADEKELIAQFDKQTAKVKL